MAVSLVVTDTISIVDIFLIFPLNLLPTLMWMVEPPAAIGTSTIADTLFPDVFVVDFCAVCLLFIALLDNNTSDFLKQFDILYF